MPTASLALELQVWAVMESLAKAAVAEICTLVNSQCVEMRLEIRRGQTEIESLKGKLRDLRKALREKSTSTVSQINPQLGEDQRDMSANDLYQETDCEKKEDDTNTSSPGLMNLQEDSIQEGVQEQEKRRTEMESRGKNVNRQSEEAPISALGVKVKIESIEDDENMPILEDATSQTTGIELALQSTSTKSEEFAQVWSSEENTEMHSPKFFHSSYNQAHHQSDPVPAVERSYETPDDRMETTSCSNGEEPSTDSRYVAMDDLLTIQNVPGLQPTHLNTHNILIHPHPEAQKIFSTLSAHPASGRPMNSGNTFDQPIHTGEKPFSCGLCGRGFKRKCNLKNHLKTHRIAGLPSEQIAPHLFINSQGTYTEDHNSHLSSLPQENTHFIHGKRHQSALTNPNNSPPDQTKRYADNCDLEDHDVDDNEDLEDYVVCLLEDGTEPEKKDYDKEQTIRSFRPEEPQQFNIGSVASNSKGFDSNHCCPIDVMEENDKDIAALDEENTSLEVCYTMQSEEPTIVPPVNPMSTLVESSVVPNVSTHLFPQMPGVVNKVPKRERNFICNHCGKAFYWMSWLYRHQLIHTGEKPYSCRLCGSSFTQKSSLKSHMRRNCCPKYKR